jgi:Fe-S-cluster containining protein
MINDALMIRTAKTLEDKGANLHYDRDAEYRDYIKNIDENDLSDQIISFIEKHDNGGEELALYDEDKFTNRLLSDSKQYAAILKRLLLTKHLKIRIGGNSFRVGESITNMAKTLGLENKVLDFDAYFKEEQFVWRSPLIDYADKFDFRSQQANGAGSHSKVWYYVNNVDCGFYNKDGNFCRFDSKKKGYWQIIEVIKTKGYNSIKPATCALICGKDSRISGRQQAMLEEEGIDYINVFNLLIR